MRTSKNNAVVTVKPVGADFFERLWGESWAYIKTVVDVVREPVLILDQDFRVMVANAPFYRTFSVKPADTEKIIVYELGNGQWDIPDLRRLLGDILPKDTFFKGFEVTHEFPLIGQRVMLLSARQIHSRSGGEHGHGELFPPIILLAIEDITEIMDVAKNLADHKNQFEIQIAERTERLEVQITQLERVINELKTRD